MHQDGFTKKILQNPSMFFETAFVNSSEVHQTDDVKRSDIE